MTTEHFEEQWSIVDDMDAARSSWGDWNRRATATLFPIRGTIMQSLAAFWHARKLYFAFCKAGYSKEEKKGQVQNYF